MASYLIPYCHHYNPPNPLYKRGFKDTPQQRLWGIENLINIYSNSPSADHFKKALELVDIFKKQNITCKYGNVPSSATAPLILAYNPESQEMANDIARILKIYFKLDTIPGKNKNFNKARFNVYFFGTPYFDEEGRVFF